MISAYAFLAAFFVQILVVSVLNPTRFIRYLRAWPTNFGSERFAQQFPDVDYSRWVERLVTRYRAANLVIAVLGLALLGWLFNLIRQPDWADAVSKPALMYFFVQMSPMALLGMYAIVRYKLRMQQQPEGKRKALLQRRGLFDFVSPFVVVVAVLTYFLFIAYSVYLDLYVWLNTSLSRQCYQAIVTITLVYALNAFLIFKYLYGKKHPLVTHEARVQEIGGVIRIGVYGSIAAAWFISIMGTLGPGPELQAWRPFALSVFLMITTLVGRLDVTAPPRKPEADVLDESPVS